MKIDMTDGKAVIDAHDLGALLGIAPQQVQQLMRSGDITSRFEKGEGQDAGRMRLTFFHGYTCVRLTCSDDGTVLSTVRTDRERKG